MAPGAGQPGNYADDALGLLRKAVNSELPHAAKRAVERGLAADVPSARAALRELSERVGRGDLPIGTIVDSSYPDRLLVPFGDAGFAVYQFLRNGTARLKTVLNRR
jgi:hypothetical protein